jgi:hypothetical protein
LEEGNNETFVPCGIPFPPSPDSSFNFIPYYITGSVLLFLGLTGAVTNQVYLRRISKDTNPEPSTISMNSLGFSGKRQTKSAIILKNKVGPLAAKNLRKIQGLKAIQRI